MPTKPKNADECPLCQGPGGRSFADLSYLCNDHQRHVTSRFEELLQSLDGDMSNFLGIVFDWSLSKLSNDEVQGIIAKKLNQKLPLLITKNPKFNCTQALKRYCREKYKEMPHLQKPPKNSASKREFVEWAKQNNVDISHFRTRAYRKRDETDEAEDYEEDDEHTDAAAEAAHSSSHPQSTAVAHVTATSNIPTASIPPMPAVLLTPYMAPTSTYLAFAPPHQLSSLAISPIITEQKQLHPSPVLETPPVENSRQRTTVPTLTVLQPAATTAFTRCQLPVAVAVPTAAINTTPQSGSSQPAVSNKAD